MTWFCISGGVSRAAFRAAMVGAVFALITGSAPAHAISCVGFVKEQIKTYAGAAKLFAPSITGPDMYNAARKSSSSYVGSMPSKGAIMIFAIDNTKVPNSKGQLVPKLPDGHAAIVSKIIDKNSDIRVDHANWGDSVGKPDFDRKVTSTDRWSTAKVQFNGSMGSTTYNVLGFISPALISIKK